MPSCAGPATGTAHARLAATRRLVGHAQHLAVGDAERAPSLCNRRGDRAADAGIDFVEHHGRHRIQAQRGGF